MPLAALSQVRCPTLFVVGEADPIVPVSVMRETAERVPSSEVVVIERAGHSAYFENPTDFNRQTLDFLDRRVRFSSPPLTEDPGR